MNLRTRSHSRREHLVRPRLIWAGVTITLAGVVVVGVGIAMLSLIVTTVGAALLLFGTSTGLAGGVMYDAVRSPDLGAELRQARRGDVHEGVRAGDLIQTPEALEDAARTAEKADSMLASGGYDVPTIGPLAGWIIFAAATLLVFVQPWADTSAVSQGSSLRDTGLAIVAALAGLQIALGGGRHRIAAALGLLTGIGLLLSALLANHTEVAATAGETVAGVLIAAASLGTLLNAGDVGAL